MRRLIPALSFAFVVLPATASADVIDPRVGACDGKNEGDACNADGDEGSCQKDTCSKLDYDGGVPPESVDYDCMLCKPGKPEAEPAPEDEKAEEPTPAATKEEAADAKPAATTETDKPKNKSGCSVGASPVSMASMGLGLLMLGWIVRRRPQA